MIDISEISRRLSLQAESVVKHLLPNGSMEGREWVVGSVGGEQGKSTKICISGDKVGIWQDFAEGEGGDLIDLWKAARCLNMIEALREIKIYLGIQETTFSGPKTKSFKKPVAPTSAKAVETASVVMEYLKNERLITKETIKIYRVGECKEVGPWPGWKPQKPLSGPWIIFAFRNGEDVLGLKYLHVKRF